MNKIQRMETVLRGERPNGLPVSCWYHFDVDQRRGRAAVDAHMNHLETYDLDFLKVMNDNGYPYEGLIHDLEDFDRLEVLSGDEPAFADQLELLDKLASKLDGRALMSTTLFNAWATLRRLIKPKAKSGPPKMTLTSNPADDTLTRFLAEDRTRVARAVEIIGKSLANFARRCIDAGANGVFLSVRDDWVDTDANGTGTYHEMVRAGDLAILAAAEKGTLNMLHVCGPAKDFAAFAEYPVHMINWADRSAGPSLESTTDWVKPTLCGGVDNLTTLPNGTPEQCQAEVADALRQVGDRVLVVAPGCTFDPGAVPPKNLHAMVEAAHRA